jgi:hypothetical protein
MAIIWWSGSIATTAIAPPPRSHLTPHPFPQDCKRTPCPMPWRYWARNGTVRRAGTAVAPACAATASGW